MGRSTNFGFHTHKECASFSSGFCIMSGIVVDPNGTACPNFTPKRMITTPHSARAFPQAQQTRWLPPYFSESTRQFYYSPGYIPNLWEMYSYQIYPWNSYEYFDYLMMLWLNFPLPYAEYCRPAYVYGYQPYYVFTHSHQLPPQTPYEELIMLEAYRRELQAEIEELDARIRKLKRWVEMEP